MILPERISACQSGRPGRESLARAVSEGVEHGPTMPIPALNADCGRSTTGPHGRAVLAWQGPFDPHHLRWRRRRDDVGLLSRLDGLLGGLGACGRRNVRIIGRRQRPGSLGSPPPRIRDARPRPAPPRSGRGPSCARYLLARGGPYPKSSKSNPTHPTREWEGAGADYCVDFRQPRGTARTEAGGREATREAAGTPTRRSRLGSVICGR